MAFVVVIAALRTSALTSGVGSCVLQSPFFTAECCHRPCDQTHYLLSRGELQALCECISFLAETWRLPPLPFLGNLGNSSFMTIILEDIVICEVLGEGLVDEDDVARTVKPIFRHAKLGLEILCILFVHCKRFFWFQLEPCIDCLRDRVTERVNSRHSRRLIGKPHRLALRVTVWS